MDEASVAGEVAESALPGPLLVDAHVHLRAGFDVAEFLWAAARNLEAAVAGRSPHRATGCLLFADPPGEAGFERLRARAASRERRDCEPLRGSAFGEWAIHGTPEITALLARGPAGERLLLIAGHQAVTAEGVELLALGARRDPGEDRPPLSEAVRRILEQGAIAVVPWGFGKWWGARRRAIDFLLASSPGPGVFLGDNAGRPQLFPESGPFRRARRAGIPVLPGSDPLPLRREAGAAGRYGFRLEGDLSGERPATALLDRLRGLEPGEPIPIGRRARLWEFVRAQVAIRTRATGAHR